MMPAETLADLITDSTDFEDWKFAKALVEDMKEWNQGYLCSVCKLLKERGLFEIDTFPESVHPDYVDVINTISDFCSTKGVI
jgi:hypothetical protein